MAISEERVRAVFNKSGLNEEIKQGLLRELQGKPEVQPKDVPEETKEAATGFPITLAAAAAYLYYLSQ